MKVPVELGERSYEVSIGPGVRHELKQLVASRAPRARNATIIASSALADQPWFDLDSGLEQFVELVPDGEVAKRVRVAEDLLERLGERHHSRDDVVVAVGGGAVTDLAGFVAAVYARGVPLVLVPTSLVGQVDAAIGGKTGVNLLAGKNLAGAFHQPLGVLCDADVLESLPERERRSGLGEVAKCWLLTGRRSEDVAQSSQHELVVMAVTMKAEIVSRDEREGGARVLLNYGHTLAHALERIALSRNPDELRHGEAVAIGLAYAVRLARALGRVGDDDVRHHDEVLDVLGLAHELPANFATDDLVNAMGHDKKAHHDLSFVLPGRAGFSLVSSVSPQVVGEVLDRWRGER